jgi:hypothetical protein
MYVFSELLSVDFCLFIVPAVTYSKPDLQEKLIKEENRGKSGVYR